MRKQHSEDGKAFACEHCGKSFALKSNLVIHQKTHDLDKPFGCDKCEKTYKQRNSLREHVLKSHDNISKFICVVCFEKFASRHLLKVMLILIISRLQTHNMYLPNKIKKINPGLAKDDSKIIKKN